MARCANCTRQAQAVRQSETLQATCPCTRGLREEFEDMPMRRYTNPIPFCGCGSGCGHGGTDGSMGADSAAILEALEQQNRLLTELLGAVTGLTAACLCRSKTE